MNGPERDGVSGSSRPRNFSPWHQWMTRLAATTQGDPLPIGPDGGLVDPAGLEAWRQRTRDRLAELLGPAEPCVPLDLEVTGSVQCDGYRRDRIVFDVESDMAVPAYLLVPGGQTEPGSAVLAIHGHGPGKSLLCGMLPGGGAQSEPGPDDDGSPPKSDWAIDLAQRGHLVLVPDLRCFGERADWNPPDHYGCDTNLVHTVMAGSNPLAQNLADLARCLDVLEEHPLVDRTRIGVAGFSYGATCALFLAALDARVAAAVVSGFFSSWTEAHKMPWNMCGSQVLPGMLGRIEHVDLAALVAPRPLLIESGTEDLLFPVATATAGVAALAPVYAALGAPAAALEHRVFDGNHRWNGAGWTFLDHWLLDPVEP